MAISLRNRQRKVRVETAWLRRVAQKTLRALGRPTAECSVVLVDDIDIAALNRTYRGVAGPTDVLAFPMTEGPLAEVTPECLGDVVISAETAARQARGGDLRTELALLLVHGMLHLVGYDHGTIRERRRMWKRQTDVLAACGFAAPDGWASLPPAR
jgi:probable rRNA maturation factor